VLRASKIEIFDTVEAEIFYAVVLAINSGVAGFKNLGIGAITVFL
jgi:hypothetical protein